MWKPKHSSTLCVLFTTFGVACGEAAEAPLAIEEPTSSDGSTGSPSPSTSAGADGGGASAPADGTGGAASGPGGGGQGGDAGVGGAGGGAPSPPSASVSVKLTPQNGVSGLQRVNFAVPLAEGLLDSADLVRVVHGGDELSAARRGLARYPGQSLRSVQLQVDVPVSGPTELLVEIGVAPTTADLELAPVATTLANASGTQGPKVWAQLPASWLSESGVAGPQVPQADVAGTKLAVWTQKCDYDKHGVDSFLAQQSDGPVWLYDRGTVMYRGHARRGDLATLRSAYRETALYRAGVSGQGNSLSIAVPGKTGDMKYYYSQNMAIHYLLTGDDRFRETAERVAESMGSLFNENYSGGGGFWTERHAGFLLLAYVWAGVVSDDKAAVFHKLADEAVKAYVKVQESYPPGYSDPNARCFARGGSGNWSCSPWMSAILADGLDAYATARGGREASVARASIVKLGRMLEKQGRDGSGRPYYMMGLAGKSSSVDAYEEHWGESAYVIAMAWYHDGKKDAALAAAVDALVAGFSQKGVAPHLRSFNWQCRSAVAAPWYLLQ